jgi:predicted transcriptional regulator
MPLYHSLLTAVALSDGKTHAVYKRANVSKEVGDKAIEDLVQRGILTLYKTPKKFTLRYG